jgi:hypothetical protein
MSKIVTALFILVVLATSNPVDGVATGDVSSDNGGRGIVAQNASVINSTMTLNKGVGLSTICPSAILNNTIVANASSIQTEENGCVLENNGNAAISSKPVRNLTPFP